MAWWQDSDVICKEIIGGYTPRCGAGTWSYDNVSFKISDGVAQVKLNDARTGNALRHKTVSALLDICVELHARPDVKTLVLTASGFYFCSGGAFGADVPDDDAAYGPAPAGASRFEAAVAENLPIAHLLYLMSTLPQYKVCAIRGVVLGAGISLVAAMDFVFAPDRCRLSFKEASRGLGACCSWQSTVAKIGVMAMRRLSLLAEDLDMASAQRLGLTHELVSGTVAEAQVKADALALAKAEEVASYSSERRQALKTTGPSVARKLPGVDPEELLKEALKGSPRGAPARFTSHLWPYKDVALRMTGQHVAELEVNGASGLAEALQELHKAASGQVRMVQITCDVPLDIDLSLLRRALLLLQLVPAVVVGLPPPVGRGRQALLWAQCDLVLARPEAKFSFYDLEDFSELIPFQVHGILGAKEAEDLGLVTVTSRPMALIAQICEKLSRCAPSAVAQSKMFIHKIGSLPMNLQRHRELAQHIARRMEDPEFEDSIRALLDKAHVPVYLRPGNKVVPAHLLEEVEEEAESYGRQEDGTVLI